MTGRGQIIRGGISMYGCKETLCTRCGHKDVCAFKSNFLSAQHAVDNLSYGCGENETMRLSDDKRFSIELRCNHHTPDVKYREK